MFSKQYKPEDFDEDVKFKGISREQEPVVVETKPHQTIEPKPDCGTCLFKFQETCKCFSSKHYNKETPDDGCEYYLKDDVDKLSIDEKEE